MRGGAGNDTYVVFEAATSSTRRPAGRASTRCGRASPSASLAERVKGEVENLTLIGDCRPSTPPATRSPTRSPATRGDNRLNGNSGADRWSAVAATTATWSTRRATSSTRARRAPAASTTSCTFVSIDLSGPQALGTVENLRCRSAPANLNAHGNARANELVGNSGINVLTGGAGNDLLTGGGGGDFFVFATRAERRRRNVDVIARLQRRAGHDPAGEPVLHRARQRHAGGGRVPHRRRGGRRLGPHHLRRRHRGACSSTGTAPAPRRRSASPPSTPTSP